MVKQEREQDIGRNPLTACGGFDSFPLANGGNLSAEHNAPVLSLPKKHLTRSSMTQ